MLQSLPRGVLSSVPDHPRWVAISAKFGQQIAGTRLSGLTSEDIYYSTEREVRPCGSSAPLGLSWLFSSLHHFCPRLSPPRGEKAFPGVTFWHSCVRGSCGLLWLTNPVANKENWTFADKRDPSVRSPEWPSLSQQRGWVEGGTFFS